MLEILEYGPQKIQAGESFLPQPNGENVLWIKVSQPVSKFAVVIFNDVSLTPDISEDGLLMTLRLLPEITMLAGKYEVKIDDAKLGIASNSVYLEVHENKLKPNLIKCILDRILRLHAKQLKFSETFRGWGMASQHILPWEQDPVFHSHLSKMNSFIKNDFFHGRENFLDKSYVDELRWRHAFLFYYARQAALSAKRNGTVMYAVEAGVGDGKTSYSLLTGFQSAIPNFKLFLFDAWTTIDNSQLDTRESGSKNSYSDLSLKETKKNLKTFSEYTEFIPGRLPDSLANLNLIEPGQLYLVHVDLNVAEPTRSVLEALWPKLAPGGTMIFDDYGWINHQATRDAIDPLIRNIESSFMLLPTGQAILTKI